MTPREFMLTHGSFLRCSVRMHHIRCGLIVRGVVVWGGVGVVVVVGWGWLWGGGGGSWFSAVTDYSIELVCVHTCIHDEGEFCMN